MPVVFPAWALVKRELLGTLRRARSFLCVAVFVAGCMGVAVMNWPHEGERFATAGAASRQVLETISFTLLCGAILFVPAFAAGAFVTEREKQTFDLLSLTLVRPTGVLAAKLLNAVAFFLLLFVASVPVLAVTLFLIGVEWALLSQTFLVILATAVACAAAGVLSSAMFHRMLAAVVGAYVGMFAFLVGPVYVGFVTLIAYSFFGQVRSIGYGLQQWAVVGSPFTTLAVIFARGLDPWQMTLAFGYYLAFTGACCLLTLRILRRPPKPARVPTGKPIDDPAVLWARRTQFPFYLVDPLRRKKTIEDGRNPMLVKELRWGLMNRASMMIRVFYCAAVVYVIAGAAAVFFGRRDFHAQFNWVFVQMVLTVALAPALISNALTKEHELGNIDMLRMTLLKPREMVLGKVLAGAVSLAPLVLAAVLTCVPISMLMRPQWDLLVTGYVTLSVCTLLSLSLGMFASMLTKRTIAALSLSYLFSAVVFVGAYLLAGTVLESLLPIDGRAESLAAYLSPIAAFARNCELRERSWLITEYWVSNAAVYTVLSCVLIKVSLTGFRQYWMQDR